MTNPSIDTLAAAEAAVSLGETDRPVLVRTYETIEIAADGRNLEILCVPFNTPAIVGDPPDYKPYREEFLHGAFAGATKAPNRVLLDFEHQTAMHGVLGHGAELTERADALYGRFRVTEHPDGDKALALVRDDVLKGASIMFKPLRSVRTPEGVVQRVKAHLDRVSLCRIPAFEQAQVLAVREAPPAAFIQVPVMPEHLTQRLAELGVEPLGQHTVVRNRWDASPGRYTDDEYQQACLIDRGGDLPVKERCALAVLEPNGDVNTHALTAAAARLSQVMNVTRDQRSAAARKLIRYYRLAEMTPPPNVTNLA